MPGYRALSTHVTGAAADSAREAESLRRDGDPHTAAILLEEALEASAAVSSELPGWLCGRLAALYRTLGRHDDEVMLLERYRASQTSDDARSRYDARLSKARTIAERKRRRESGAVASVRQVLGSSRRRSAASRSADEPEAAAAPARPEPRSLPASMLAPVIAAFTDRGPLRDEHLASAVTTLAAKARAEGVSVEELVSALRDSSRDAVSPSFTEDDRAERFGVALLQLLGSFFGEG